MTVRTIEAVAASGQSDRVGLPFFFSLSVALLLAALASVACPLPVRAEAEFRGVWVVRHTLISERSIREMVATAKRSGANALLVQVRGRGDAYYRSDLVPRAEGIIDGDTFDPLATVLAEGHRVGLQVHAWFNVYLTWPPGSVPPLSDRHLLHQHPNWFMQSGDGVEMGGLDLRGIDLVERGVEGRYLSPAIPEVRWHLVDVLEELLQRYDVDGIHLDYLRYPNRHYDFNPSALLAFAQEHAFDPKSDYAENGRVDGSGEESGPLAKSRRQRAWERWRADQVTHFVELARGAIRRTRTQVILSAAVKPDFVTAYESHGQDWIRWMNSGMLDAVMPMFYTGGDRKIEAQIRESRKYVKKGAVYAGLGTWNQSLQSTLTQVELARRWGLKGVVLFSYDTLAENPELVRRLGTGPFGRPADPPVLAKERRE